MSIERNVITGRTQHGAGRRGLADTALTTIMRRLLNGIAAAALGATVAVTATGTPAQAVGGFQIVTVYESREWCLDSNFEGRVYLGGCNGGHYQRWADFEGNTQVLKNVATNRCLDTNGTSIYTHPCSRHWNAHQIWSNIHFPMSGFKQRNAKVDRCLNFSSQPSGPVVDLEGCADADEFRRMTV